LVAQPINVLLAKTALQAAKVNNLITNTPYLMCTYSVVEDPKNCQVGGASLVVSSSARNDNNLKKELSHATYFIDSNFVFRETTIAFCY
jgi:hypothetical protein